MHEQTIALRHALNKATDLPAKVAEVLKEEFKQVDASADLKKLNDEFLSQHKDSPQHVLAAIRAKRTLGEDEAKCDKEVTGILDIPGIGFEDAIVALETLKRLRSSEEATFQKAALAKWPEVTRLA